MSNERLGQLAEAGVSIWLDDLSRERLISGNLQELITDKHVTGVTTNPTIFAGALAKGDAYDAQVRELAARGASVEDAVREITVADVQQACDVFSGTWETTNGVDGRVSLEVDPGLARDTEGTVAQALDLWKAVDRPNLLVKIPATEAGLPAITKALAEGVSVNVTLIFSVERHRAAMGAYLDGLEQAPANGPRLAYAAYQEVFAGPRWDALAAKGARVQRPLWASTGVKNPEYPDTLYVSELVAPGTVNTMPEKTMKAYADHGEPGTPVQQTYEDAASVLKAVAEAGVDLDDVFRVIEDE